MMKAALYIRVSTSYQIDKDSLPMQKTSLINYCQYALNISEYEIFEDAGYSAKNTDRPAYQKMMERLRTKEFSHLIVWKIDRISRNLLDFSNMYTELKKLGVIFVSQNEQFDTSSAMGEAMLKIILVFAELERKITSERVSATMLSRATKGLWNGGRIPYGYTYTKETQNFEISPSEAQIVQRIYNLYLAGNSILTISKNLNNNLLKSPSGKEWSAAAVYKILTNIFYIGSYRYNVKDENNKTTKNEEEWLTIDDHHPAIIQTETYYFVQDLLQSKNRNSQNHTYQRKNTHIFAGVVYCGSCGSIMQANKMKSTKKNNCISIYACASRRTTGNCTNKGSTDLTIGPFVFNFISNLFKAYQNCGKTTTLAALEKKLLRGTEFENVTIEKNDLKQILGYINKRQLSNIILSPIPPQSIPADITQIENVKEEIKAQEKALSKLEDLYLFAHISKKDYLIKKKELESKIESSKEKLDNITHKPNGELHNKASFVILSEFLLRERNIDFNSLRNKLSATVLKEFISRTVSKIVIKNDNISLLKFSSNLTVHFINK